MPKVRDTRKNKAAELLRMLANGPGFSEPVFSGEVFTAEEASRQFRNWSQAWILPLIHNLVPELRRREVKP